MEFCEFCVFFLLTLTSTVQCYRPPWELLGSNIAEWRRTCELTILRSEAANYNEGQRAYLICQANCGDSLPSALYWMDNNGHRVPEVRRFSGINGAIPWFPGTLRYDIGVVTPQHSGHYICKANLEGSWMEKSTYLNIIPTYPSTTTSTTSTSTTTTSAATTPTTPETTTTQATTSLVTTIPTTAEPTTTPTGTSTQVITTTRPSDSVNQTDSLQTGTTTVSNNLPESVEENTTLEPLNAENTATQFNAPSNENVTQEHDPNNGVGATTTETQTATTVTPSTAHPITNSTRSQTIQPTTTTQSQTETSTRNSSSSSTLSSTTILSEDTTSVSQTTQLPGSDAEPNNSTTVTEDTEMLTDASVTEVNSENEGGLAPFLPGNDTIENLPMREELGHTDEIILPDNNGEPSNEVHGKYAIIPAVHRLLRRRKRNSNTTYRGMSYEPFTNGTVVIDDTRGSNCSGFGPIAIATIAILGAFCLILLYGFFLVLCLRRNRNSRAEGEKSINCIEEGNVEEIETNEKVENRVSDPNGRISHGEETLASSGGHQATEIEMTSAVIQEAVSGTSETTSKDKEVDEKSDSHSEEPIPEVLLLPEVDEQEDLNRQDVTGESDEPNGSPAADSTETDDIAEINSPEIFNDQQMPVFDEAEPQELMVKESYVGDVNVEVEDKAVDTVELESQELTEPLQDAQDTMEENSDERLSNTDNYDPLIPEVTTEDSTQVDNLVETVQENGHNGDIDFPQKQNMSESIEDLPPPPPIPVKLLPSPTQNEASNADLDGQEPISEDSANVTMV